MKPIRKAPKLEMYLFLKQNAGQNNLTRKERSDFLRNI